MNPYVILTDSSGDLTDEIVAGMPLETVQLEVILDGEGAKPNCDIDIQDFYAKLRSKKNATTSAVGIDAFLAKMEPILQAGNDILYIGFSSGLSGTFNAGFVAAQELAEKYPERTIATVNTRAASLGEGLLVYLALKMKQDGADMETVRQYLENNKLHLCHWFTVDDLFFLKRGGRVNAATAVVGTMLGIKPMNCNTTGFPVLQYLPEFALTDVH